MDPLINPFLYILPSLFSFRVLALINLKLLFVEQINRLTKSNFTWDDINSGKYAFYWAAWGMHLQCESEFLIYNMCATDLLSDEWKPRMSLYSSGCHFLLAQANIIGFCIGLL